MRYLLSGVFLLAACAGPRDALVVKQFQLRDQERNSGDEPLIRMEKSRRLLGAVSMAERKERLGQYYTVIWNDPVNMARDEKFINNATYVRDWADPAGTGQGEVEVVFQYQQGATGSLVKRMVKKFPASETKGTAEFAVIGEDYFKNGKVLTWKATLRRGGREIASRQSYLWQ